MTTRAQLEKLAAERGYCLSNNGGLRFRPTPAGPRDHRWLLLSLKSPARAFRNARDAARFLAS